MFSVVQIRIAGVAVIGITASGKRVYVRRYASMIKREEIKHSWKSVDGSNRNQK